MRVLRAQKEGVLLRLESLEAGAIPAPTPYSEVSPSPLAWRAQGEGVANSVVTQSGTAGENFEFRNPLSRSPVGEGGAMVPYVHPNPTHNNYPHHNPYHTHSYSHPAIQVPHSNPTVASSHAPRPPLYPTPSPYHLSGGEGGGRVGIALGSSSPPPTPLTIRSIPGRPTRRVGPRGTWWGPWSWGRAKTRGVEGGG